MNEIIPTELIAGPTIWLPKKNIVIDATTLSALMTCARFTDLNFNRRFQPLTGKSNSLECGSIIHKGLEVYYKAVIGGVKKSEAAAFGFAAAQLYIAGCKHCTDFQPLHDFNVTLGNLDEQHVCTPKCILKPPCGHPVNEYPGVRNTPQEAEKSWQIGWQWVLTTYEQYLEFWRNDFWVPLEAEVVKSRILYEDDEIRVLWKAKLDWIVDTNVAILPADHKTMKANRDSITLNNQFMGQCHVMETRQMIVNKIGFQKTLPANEKFIREMMNFSSDRLIEWSSEILPYWCKMMLMWQETGLWPADFSNCESKYGRCKYYDVCSADRNMRESILQKDFMIGPEWNPSNMEDGDA